MIPVNILVFLILLGFAAYSVISRRLTFPAALTGVLTGWFIFKGTGLTGVGMLATFFIASSLATSWQYPKKKKLGFSPGNTPRSTGQVLANGGLAGILGLAAWLYPGYIHIITLATAGALASAAADTLSSEVGSVSGKTFYDILSLKKAAPGPDGIISVTGSLAGVFGAILVALVYLTGAGNALGSAGIIVAGIAGNLFDSVLGASLERKGIIGNNAVNFLNTAAGAVMSVIFVLCFH